MKNPAKLLLLMVLGAHSLFAQEIATKFPAKKKMSVNPFRDKLKISYVTRSWEYQETAKAKMVMQESGFLQGVKASYTLDIGKEFFLRPEGSYIGGNTEYDGATWGGKKIKSEDRHVIANAELMIGYRPELSKQVSLTLGLSAHYRSLIHPRTKSPGSYRRVIGYQTVAATFSPTFRWASSSFFLTPLIRYDHLVKGVAKTYLERANSKYPNLKLRQKKGRGILYSLEAAVVLNKMTLKITPYFQSWKVKDSEQSQVYDIYNSETDQSESMYWMEPENKTSSFGADFSIAF